MPQVLVKLSAQICQTFVIGGFQDNVLGYIYSVQWLRIIPLSVKYSEQGPIEVLLHEKVNFNLRLSGDGLSVCESASQRIGQSFGDYNVDELANTGSISVKIYPAHVFGASGELTCALLRGFFRQYSLNGANHGLTDCPGLLIDPRLQQSKSLFL